MPDGDPWRNHILGQEGQPSTALVQPEAGPPEADTPEADPPVAQRQTDSGNGQPRTADSTLTAKAPGPAITPSYHLAAFAVLAWAVALLLAALDEYWRLPHAASINAALFLAAVLVILSLVLALRRARAWRRAHSPNSTEYRDQVTGLPNYRYLLVHLEEETSRARRFHRPLSLAIVDINSLNSLNTEYGRECGDDVVRHVAESIQSCLRNSDVATRLADGRFAIIIPECDEEAARNIIERLEQHLTRSPAHVDVDRNPQHLWVGICAGVALLGDGLGGAGDLVRRAEANLQGSKEERNKRRRLWLSA